MNKALLKDLPELVSAGVISEETAQRIINHYEQKQQSTANPLTIILGILGALLAGSGVLLIVAHNWDELSVAVKTTISFLPLLLAQSACAYTLLKRKHDRTWRECSSMFLFFSIGASIALISQIYQVNGSMPEFLLVWVLLALPLIYIFSATTLALFCIAAITWYAAYLGYEERYGPIPFMYVAVLVLIAPHYYKLYKNNPGSNFYTLLNWFVAISITITLGCFSLKDNDPFEWIFLLYCMLFCVFYFIGRSPFFQAKKVMANPFLIIGTLGIITTLLTWSFSFVWREYKLPQSRDVFNNPLFYLIAVGAIGVVLMAWKQPGSKNEKLPDPMGYSGIVLLLLLVFMKDAPSIAVFITNAWILFIGIYFIRRGSVTIHFGIVNFGLAIIASLAVCRFFDERIPFVWRGIFFLATGISFFAANYLLIRKRKQLAILPSKNVL